MSPPSYPMTRKQLLDMSTAITNLDLDENVCLNELGALDVLLTPDQALIPRTRKRKQWWKRGRRSGILTRLRRRANRPPLPSVLWANVQTLENKLDLCLRLFCQQGLKNCNILCFSELWLNRDMDNVHLVGFSMHRQKSDSRLGKTEGREVRLFVNNSWCVISNDKEVKSFCPPE